VSRRFSRSLSVWVVASVLAPAFAGLAGCGGSSAPAPTAPRGPTANRKAMVADIQARNKKSKFLRKVGRNYVLELPSRTGEDD
jgi:hypothetical protein